RLSRASLVKLVGGSQLTVVPATAERPPRIVLHRGSLTAHVQPGARRALALTVDTPRGSVRVTGTVFGVDVAAQGAEAARVEVSVLHGSVRVAERDAVRAGQRWRSDGTREALDAAQRARLGRAVTLLDLVGAHNSGQLRIDSEPAGAAVRIDGVLVGRTPLVAALPAGQRTLELSLAGHTPVREFLAVTAAARLSRRYGLAPLPSQAPDKPTPRARAVKVSVEVLRARAQKARAERRWRAAAAAYRQLVQRSPRRAGAARLSLAELELVHLGHPRAALAHFARYLAQHPKGLLAAEALWGKARALRALGRSKAEREALETLVRRFAHAPQVTLARRRLRALPR
ncbi:MAG: PEGA domain-containing protein, partial [Myxococcales bacterium]|nr:PEGA domain-containing protein [Myxococcales bacterium]